MDWQEAVAKSSTGVATRKDDKYVYIRTCSGHSMKRKIQTNDISTCGRERVDGWKDWEPK